jgi:hypothetical protein
MTAAGSGELLYLEDTPAHSPGFDFEIVASALADLFLQPTQGAFVLGIHGPWGSGKTTLMRAVRAELEGRCDAAYVDFNAWKYHQREALWRALLLQVTGEVRRLAPVARGLDELEDSLYRGFAVQEAGPWKLNWGTLITELVSIALSVLHLDFVAKALGGAGSWVGRLFGKGKPESGVIDDARVRALAGVLERTTIERQVHQVQSIEQFLARFQEVVRGITQDRRIFVLIDDLDRCLPENALEIFESIKLFLDSAGCGFVVAVDRDVISKGLQMRYRDTGTLINPDEYIEKTITLSFDVPRLSGEDVLGMIDGVGLPSALVGEHRELLLTGVGVNPRRAKRVASVLALQCRLAERAAERGRRVPACLVDGTDAGDLGLYLKLLLLAYRQSGLIAMALEDPGLLERLQRLANAYEAGRRGDALKARQARNDGLNGEPTLVQGLADDEETWRLLVAGPSLLDRREDLMWLMTWFRQAPPAVG